MTNALVIDNRRALMPVMEIGEAVALRQMFVDYVKAIMVENVDYGIIPGASKPSLQKPGAEKLAAFFGLAPSFEDITAVEDWTGAEHGGEPFFYYRLRCHLHRDERRIASADGSCNSWETKYRYRQSERVCPNCGKAAIIKGRTEYGGGWVCFAKKGGCGAKYADGDSLIEGQQVGRIPNPDPAEQVNTFLKIAQKRALVAAVLIAVNASEFFTQDIEDMVTTDYRIVDTETGEVTTPPAPKNSKPTSQPATPAPKGTRPQAVATKTAPQTEPRTPEQLREHLRNSAHANANEPELTVGWRDGLIGTIDKMTEPDGHHAFLAWAFDSATGSRKDMTNGQLHALRGWLQTHQETQTVTGKDGQREEKKVWVLNEIPAAELLAAYPVALAYASAAPAFPAATDLHPDSAHLEATQA